MASSKITSNRTIYSFAQKVNALKLLRENGYNYSKTARELSLLYKTIQRWNKSIGKVVFELLDLYEGDCDCITEEEVECRLESISNSKVEEEYSSRSFDLLAQKVKMTALRRLDTLIPNETDLSKITSALKLLHKMIQEHSPSNETDEIELPDYMKELLEKYQQ